MVRIVSSNTATPTRQVRIEPITNVAIFHAAIFKGNNLFIIVLKNEELIFENFGKRESFDRLHRI